MFKLINKLYPIPKITEYVTLDEATQDYLILMNSVLPVFHELIYIISSDKQNAIDFIYTFTNNNVVKTKYSANNFLKKHNSIPSSQTQPIDVPEVIIPSPKKVSFNEIVWNNAQQPSDQHEKQRLENEHKALEKQEAEIMKQMQQLEFNAIKRTFTDYKNYMKIPDKTMAYTSYPFLDDMMKNEQCIKNLQELDSADIDKIFIDGAHDLSQELVQMCKRYVNELRRNKKNFDHKWDAFESDVPIASNIEIKTKT